MSKSPSSKRNAERLKTNATPENESQESLETSRESASDESELIALESGLERLLQAKSNIGEKYQSGLEPLKTQLRQLRLDASTIERKVSSIETKISRAENKYTTDLSLKVHEIDKTETRIIRLRNVVAENKRRINTIEKLSAITGNLENSADIAGVLDAKWLLIAFQALKGYERVKSILLDEQSNLKNIGSALLATIDTATDEEKRRLQSALSDESGAKKRFGAAENDLFVRVRDGVIIGLEHNHAPLIKLRLEKEYEIQRIKTIQKGDAVLSEGQLGQIIKSNQEIEECDRQIQQYGPVVDIMEPLRIALNQHDAKSK